MPNITDDLDTFTDGLAIGRTRVPMAVGKEAARLEVSLVDDPQYGGGLSSIVFSSATFCTFFKNIASDLTRPSSLDDLRFCVMFW
ncbi:hypothetical protein PIB30_019905 [Stylosanthes scabra]|uniref:Uncharacterized protein n=1 Tax=Stylosanthes scabra TaxID=79078 RepID=A0ABU6V7B0_9FABA|nr:hypothetical protein [Stylosanthes scabra]